MSMDAVIGCDAVDAGNDWLRLHTVAGPVRTIPWESVKAAGTPNGSIRIDLQGVTDKVAPYIQTHDALWITHADGVAQIMLEKASPKSNAIVAAFERQLGARWRSSGITTQDLISELSPLKTKGGIPKVLILMIVMSVMFLLLALVLPLILRHQ